MMNHHARAFRELFEETSRHLMKDSAHLTGLIHAGEFGSLRELVCRQFLRPLTPSHLSISSGFVITPQDHTSKQCDIVVFDKTWCPFSDMGELGPFYPAESVVAVGEVKSVLRGKSEYKSATNHLAEIRGTVDYAGQRDDLFSFLVFDHFGQEKSEGADHPTTTVVDEHQLLRETRGLADGIGTLKHDAYLSVRQGLVDFGYNESLAGCDRTKRLRMILPGSSVSHIKAFALIYFAAVTKQRPTAPDLRRYIKHHSNDIFVYDDEPAKKEPADS
jgi:hypothetical protein